MHPEVELLARLLDEAAELLQSYGEPEWANWLLKDASLIRRSDFYGIEHLLSAFGGMGSLNDVVVLGLRGDEPRTVLTVENDRLNNLRSKIYALATKLAKEERS